MPIFPTDLALRATVKITDKLLIHNIDTGVTEYTTVQKLLEAISLLASVGIGVAGGTEMLTISKLSSGENIARISFEGQTGIANGKDNGGIRFKNDNFPYYSEITGWRGMDSEHVGLRFKTAYSGPVTLRMVILPDGKVGINTANPTSIFHVVGLPAYANNAAALAGGLTAGAFYRTNGDPDLICVVH